VERVAVIVDRGRLVAWVQSSSADGPLLRAHLAELLPEYLVPARFEVVEELPLTAAGKIDRASLAVEPDGEAVGTAGEKGELPGHVFGAPGEPDRREAESLRPRSEEAWA
jgi:hypothetical protein